MAPLPRMGRPTDLQDNIVQGLRGLIVDGKLAPGSRLPTRTILQSQYGASTNTVQRALERLKRDGFVTTDGRNGTFVSEDPPHLTRYGLIFPHARRDANWSRFFTALAQEAEGLQKADELSIPIFYGIESHTDEAEVRDFWRQVNEHLLAGLIIAAPMEKFAETPLWSEPGIPRVLIGSPPRGNKVLDVPHVSTNHRDWSAKAMSYLTGRGRKQPAFVWYRHDEARVLNDEQIWREHGFDIRTAWSQLTHSMNRMSVSRCVQLLFAGRERPDSLVIMDDNLADGVIDGLREAGVRAPDDVEIILHSNFPLPGPPELPAKRLGYDNRQIMRHCIDLIDAQRRGKLVQDVIYAPAFFEEELPGR